MADEVRVADRADADIVPARAEGRALATALGFSKTDATLIATAISEIARNIVVHVGQRRDLDRAGRRGLALRRRRRRARRGPRHPRRRGGVAARLRTRGGLGLGLPGARRLMDEFEIDSAADADDGDDDEVARTATSSKGSGRRAMATADATDADSRMERRSDAVSRRAASRATPRSSSSTTAGHWSRRSTASGTGPRRARPRRLRQTSCAAFVGRLVVSLVERCHEALRERAAPRSASPSSLPSDETMTWLGVGNVEGRVVARGERARRGARCSRPGVVGHELPSSSEETLEVQLGDTMLLATDGVDEAFAESKTCRARPVRSPTACWPSTARPRDDSLVVVARYLGRRRDDAADERSRQLRGRFDDVLVDRRRDRAPRGVRARPRGSPARPERPRPRRDPSRRPRRRARARRGSGRRRADDRAAEEFFLESLSAFEIVRRSYSEAREAALLERRRRRRAPALELPRRCVARGRRPRLARRRCCNSSPSTRSRRSARTRAR